MNIDPQLADTLWIIGVIMLGLMILFKFVNRKQFREERFERRVKRHDEADPDEMPDLEPMLRRTRIQIVMAAIGIAAITFMAIMGIGQESRGLPMPGFLTDLFR